MTQSRVGVLALFCTAMTVGAMVFSATISQATSWVVLSGKGEALEKLKALAKGELENSQASLLSNLFGVSFEIRCTAIELIGASLEAEGKVTNGFKAKFTGCESFDPTKGTLLANCRPKTSGTAFGTVETKALKGELLLSEGAGLVKIEPKEGTSFGALLFEEGCSFGESVTINGTLYLKDGEGKSTTHQVTHLLVEGLGSELWIGAKNEEHLLTSTDGSGTVSLAAEHVGLKWSAKGSEPPPEESSWLVLDAKTEGKALEALKAAVQGKVENSEISLLTHFLNLSVAVRCTASELIGANVEPEGKLTSGLKAKFTGCIFRDAESGKSIEECTPKTTGSPSGTVETLALKGELLSGEKAGLVKVEPKEGTALATLEMGAGCLLAEKISVNGTLYLKDAESKMETHLVEHLVVEGSGSELWVGAKNEEHLLTSVDGSALVSLIGAHAGLKWGSAVGKAAWAVLDNATEGKALEALKAAVQGKVENSEISLLTHLVGLSVKIRCTASEIIGASLEAKGILTTGFKAKFTGCEFLDVKSGKQIEECVPKTTGSPAGTIETNGLKGVLTEAGLVKVEPKEGTIFGNLEMGAGCLLAEKISVNGTLYLKDAESKMETHLVEHLVVEGSGSELWVGVKNEEHLLTSIDGGSLVSLGGEHAGLQWSGMP